MSAAPQVSASERKRKASEQPATEVAPATSALPKKHISLHRAELGDLVDLHAVLLGYGKEGHLLFAEIDQLHSMAWLLSLIAAGNVIIAKCDSAIVGCIALEIHACPWNPNLRYLSENLLFVDKAFRSGGTGLRLISAAKDAARTNNLPLLVGVVWGVETERLHRLFMSLGFRWVGSSFLYSPEWEKEA